MIDESIKISEVSIDIVSDLKVEFQKFFNSMHNMFFDQLMQASQDDEDLSKLLWNECAQSVSLRPKGGSIHSASDADEIPDDEVPTLVQKLFADLESEKSVPIKDQGLLTIKCGTVIAKKFKYFTDKVGKLRVFSSIPVLVSIRTPLFEADLTDKDNNKYSFVKF